MPRNRIRALAALAIGLPAVAACGNLEATHLVFGQEQSVGLTIAGSGPQQDAELTLGFKDKNIAVVPVAVKDANGQVVLTARTDSGPGLGISDSFSTIGQFELDTGKSTAVSVGLGKFFATGNAAQTLAQGFADRLSGVNAAKP